MTADGSIQRGIVARWEGWFGEDPPPLTWVLQGTGRPVAQTAVAIHVLDRRTGQHRLVVKVNRDRTFRAVIESEFEHQEEAHRLLEPTHPGTVARPLGLIEAADDLYLASAPAPVERDWETMGDSSRRDLEIQLADWLGVLHDRSTRRRSGHHEAAVEEVEKAFAELPGTTVSVQERLREATGLVREEFAESDVEMLVHGDFWSGNWLIRESGFTVIDWEHSHYSPSPILDEFLHPLSQLTDGSEQRTEVLDRLRGFSDSYRASLGKSVRTDEECALIPLWVAAEVATRTLRRWAVVEDWSRPWMRLAVRLAPS